jgi:hypothetical protein
MLIGIFVFEKVDELLSEFERFLWNNFRFNLFIFDQENLGYLKMFFLKLGFGGHQVLIFKGCYFRVKIAHF